MKIGKFYLRDKWGYPVETYRGFYPVTNFLRLVIHTNIRMTWKYRNTPLVSVQELADCQSKESQ